MSRSVAEACFCCAEEPLGMDAEIGAEIAGEEHGEGERRSMGGGGGLKTGGVGTAGRLSFAAEVFLPPSCTRE